MAKKSIKKVKSTKIEKALIKGLKQAVKVKDVKPKNGKIKLGKVSLISRTRTGPPVFNVKRIDLVGKTYPFKLKETVVAQSKSYSQALQQFSEYLKTAPKGAYCYELKDNEYTIYEFYDGQGSLVKRSSPVEQNAHYAGNPNPKFAKGEVVEVLDYDELRLAVVMATPVTPDEAKARNLDLDPSDDVYLVDFSMDTSEHSHPPEIKVRKPSFPVSKEKVKEMQEIYEALQSTLA